MRVPLAAMVLLAACASQSPPRVPVPSPETGKVSIAVATADPIGRVQPIGVAVTNGRADGLRLDARQVFASANGERTAPLTPGDAAREAGGKSAPGALGGAARGAVGGGILGAIGGVVSGAIWGSVGIATAAGAAAGAAIGAITGAATGGGGSSGDVAGFQDRALPSSTLQSGFSSTGYLYYPAGTYRTLEFLFTDERSGEVVREQVEVPVTPTE
jgi:hypothetical protein